jgi:hypothetical protein
MTRNQNENQAAPKSLEQASMPGREPTAKELAAINQFVTRTRSAPNVKLKVSDGDARKIEIEYDDKEFGLVLLMDAIGTADVDFYNGLISQLCRVNSKGGELDKRGLDFMLAVIKDVKPRDQLEALHAAQMASIHLAAMTMAHRLAISETILEQDSAERAFNKLTRTFACQMETLKRYRTNGPHTVQNVSVADGGQAVVANVTHSPSETKHSEAVGAGPAHAKANGHANGRFSVSPKERISPKPTKERVSPTLTKEGIADIGHVRRH